MQQKLLQECLGAVIKAAVEGNWNCVLSLTLNAVVEQLEESNVQSPASAVRMFKDWRDLQIEYGLEDKT